MSSAGPLQRLAAAGIDTVYRDSWGEERAVPEAAIRRLLSALRLPADTDEEIEASLQAVEAAPWRRVLPPVLVVRQAALPVRIPIRLPSPEPDAVIPWSLEEEGGTVRRSELRLDSLLVEDRRLVDHTWIEQRSFVVSPDPPAGYHRLRVGDAAMSLIVAPDTCYLPEAFADDGRLWGFSLQLYALRSGRNWGIGDFGDLARLIDAAGARGAGAIGLNPLHALFPGDPGRFGPYGPSSRLFFNSLYLDVEAVPDYAECPVARERASSVEFRQSLEELRNAPLVDHAGVARRKHEILELLYTHFRDRHLGTPVSTRGREFHAFQARGGPALQALAVFEALAEWFGTERHSNSVWRDWPPPWHSPTPEDIEHFAAKNRERVEFFEYLQWNADIQLADATECGRRHGMAVGLLHDLALGVDLNGAEAWGNQEILAQGVSLGAPPDALNLNGQDWGLPPQDPALLRERAYAPFAAVMQANMRSASALRIDHVLGLARLYWIPWGMPATDGGYVRYPLDDLLGIMALESQRNRCLVVGEDLGTVPPGLRERLRAERILSYRLLCFETDEAGDFLPPDDYPPLALVATGTHDLPTLRGWWRGLDLELRHDLGLFPDPAVEVRERTARERDRRRLQAALIQAGLLDAETPEGADPDWEPLLLAVHRYLARTPSKLMLVQLEDALGQEDQVNLPGTTDEHPNWQRKLARSVDALFDDPMLGRLIDAIVAERSRGDAHG